MNWTHEKPTEPGWYWCRMGHLDFVVHMHPSIEARYGCLIGIYVNLCGEVEKVHSDHFSPYCQWAGPLKPPSVKPNKPVGRPARAVEFENTELGDEG